MSDDRGCRGLKRLEEAKQNGCTFDVDAPESVGRGPQREVVNMKPREFWQAVTGETPEDAAEASSLGADFYFTEDVVEDGCEDGKIITNLSLEYNQDSGRIVGHEGRMRNYVFHELMPEQDVPVEILCSKTAEAEDGFEYSTATECRLDKEQLKRAIKFAEPQHPPSDFPDRTQETQRKRLQERCGPSTLY